MPSRKSTTTLAVLVFATLAVLGLLGNPPRKAAACTSCFSESATAYHFCQLNPPGTWYEGCNFSCECGPDTQSANQIYRNNCLL